MLTEGCQRRRRPNTEWQWIPGTCRSHRERSVAESGSTGDSEATTSGTVKTVTAVHQNKLVFESPEMSKQSTERTEWILSLGSIVLVHSTFDDGVVMWKECHSLLSLHWQLLVHTRQYVQRLIVLNASWQQTTKFDSCACHQRRYRRKFSTFQWKLQEDLGLPHSNYRVGLTE